LQRGHSALRVAVAPPASCSICSTLRISSSASAVSTSRAKVVYGSTPSRPLRSHV
jgi:hypothetical protein